MYELAPEEVLALITKTGQPPLLVVDGLDNFTRTNSTHPIRRNRWSVSGITSTVGQFANAARPGQRMDVLVTSPMLTTKEHWTQDAKASWILWASRYADLYGPLSLRIEHHYNVGNPVVEELRPVSNGLDLVVHVFDAEFLGGYDGEDSAFYNMLLNAVPELSLACTKAWFQSNCSGFENHFREGHVTAVLTPEPDTLPHAAVIVRHSGPDGISAFQIPRVAPRKFNLGPIPGMEG